MHKRISIILGLVLLAIAIWLQITTYATPHQLLDRLGSLISDIQLRANLLTKHPVTYTSSVVIVDIDEKSLDKVGRWPWPREKLADLVKNITDAGAAVIAFDMNFPIKEDNVPDQLVATATREKIAVPLDVNLFLNKIRPYSDNDAIFAQQISQIDTILAISFLYKPEIIGVLPTPSLYLTPQENSLGFIKMPGVMSNTAMINSAAKGVGFINSLSDDDGVIRRQPLLIRYQNGVYPTLALAAVEKYLFSTIKLVTASYENQLKIEGIMLGNYMIPTDANARVIIPFRGGSFTFPYISAVDVLTKQFSPDALVGKIVFIGTSATGLGDLKTTSVQNAFPGVEVQATIADGILKHSFINRPAWLLGAEAFITFITGLFFIFLFSNLGPRTLIIFMAINPILFIELGNWLSNKIGLAISILVPTFLSIVLSVMNIIVGYLFESKKRERLKEVFVQYVPSKHIDEMLQSNSKTDFGLQGETREMTALFADIRNFTSISESMSPTLLKNMLYEIFTPMTESIFKYHGTIDKYVGDLIMAFWGAPIEDRKHRERSLHAALEMQKIAKKLRVEFAQKNWPELRIGIGLNSGLMNVGDMGSKFRLNYTILGDEVNLASRAETLTKYYGVNIIVTEHTQHDQPSFVFRKLDIVKVKGRHDAIAIYELLGKQETISPNLLKEIEIFEQALTHYFQQQWEQAKNILISLQETRPHKKIYKIFLRRIAKFEKSPPPADWDGVYLHTRK